MKQGGYIYTPRPHATAVCAGAVWQVEDMRRENEAIEAAQRAKTAGEGAGAGAEDESQVELLVLNQP